MRHPILATVLVLTALVAAPRAQQPPAAAAAPAMTLFASSAEVAALAAKAKAEIKPGQPILAKPIVQAGSYRANLEYRTAVGPASVHEKEAELFYVIDGSATVVTGGTLTEERRTNPDNRTGAGINGGTPRRVAKGDFILVPENTAHWFSAIDGTRHADVRAHSENGGQVDRRFEAAPDMSLPPFNPLVPQFRSDPYPFYRRYREEDPVHWKGCQPPGRAPGICFAATT